MDLLDILGTSLLPDLIDIVSGYAFFRGIPEPTLEGHTGNVYSLIALPAGRLVSGSADCTIRVWDTVTGG